MCSSDLPSLNPEALTAPALIFHVRVIELEAFIQALARKIELSAIDVGQALRINKYLDPVRLKHRVISRGLVNILEFVCHPGTTGRAHTKTQPNPFAALFQITRDMLGRFFSQSDRHDQRFRFSRNKKY